MPGSCSPSAPSNAELLVTISDRPIDVVDQYVYPLHDDDSPVRSALVDRCRGDLDRYGMFDLVGLMQPAAITTSLVQVRPLIDERSFVHRRRHNIYFQPTVDGLDPDHAALREVETTNRTVCADQLDGTPVMELYRWPSLRRFVADVLAVPSLHVMDDHLAAVNVMSYRDGEALNWHFDRAGFTTTLLLQRPQAGGVFEFRRDLRTDDDPHYDDVAALIGGRDALVQQRNLDPGTLTVFAGRHTAHRVTATIGPIDRVITVYSYAEVPGQQLTDAERVGFYGRS